MIMGMTFLKLKDKTYLCVCMCIPCVSGCPWKPKEDVGSLGAEVTGGCEPPTQVLGTDFSPLPAAL